MSLPTPLNSTDPDQTLTYDIVVIGGGPTGATAALYASRADPKTMVIDKGLTAGALGATGKIAKFPGLPEIRGAELVERMRTQAQAFGGVAGTASDHG
jgi:thioredoxin reductase (NADPH)